MIQKNDILNMVRHIMRKGAHVPDRKLMHPARDWFIGLLLGAILFVASALFALYLFTAQSAQINRVVPVTETVEVYKSREAQTVLERYTSRVERFNALRGEYVDGGVSPLLETPLETPAATTPGSSGDPVIAQ